MPRFLPQIRGVVIALPNTLLASRLRNGDVKKKQGITATFVSAFKGCEKSCSLFWLTFPQYCGIMLKNGGRELKTVSVCTFCASNELHFVQIGSWRSGVTTEIGVEETPQSENAREIKATEVCSHKKRKWMHWYKPLSNGFLFLLEGEERWNRKKESVF